MIRRHLAILGLIGAVAGCDDAKISNMERRTFLNPDDLMATQEAGGLLVEAHGAPWPGATREEVIATLRMPEGKARALRFRDIPPGQGHIGTGERLVLHFNPVGPPDSTADCRATSEFTTNASSGSGFTVNATYCKGQDWLIHAYLTAKVDPDDWLGYYLAMEKLLGKMFTKK